MVRLTWLKTAIIAGGVIITAVGVVLAAKAKVLPPIAPPPEGIPPPPIPPPEGIPAIPAAIEFTVYPTSLNQLYGFYYTAPSPMARVLEVKALTSFVGPPWPEGLITERAVMRVVDAAGRGVPNVAVLIWSVPTHDDQNGQLSIDGSPRNEVEALRYLTDANGEIQIFITYELLSVITLEDKHDFGCCILGVRVQDIDVGQACSIPSYVCYSQKDARTDIKIYTVNARIEGTVKSNAFAFSCQAIGKALW